MGIIHQYRFGQQMQQYFMNIALYINIVMDVNIFKLKFVELMQLYNIYSYWETQSREI